MAFRARSGSGAVDVNDVLNQSFIERDQFNNIKMLIKLLTSNDAPSTQNQRDAIQAAIDRITGKPIAPSSDVSATSIVCAAGFYGVIISATRSHAKSAVVSADMTKLQFPASSVGDVVNAYNNARAVLETASTARAPAVAHLATVDWRVDVTISSAKLTRVFKPTIALRIGTRHPTSGESEIVTVECSVERFAQIRYEIAKALKIAHDTLAHPTLSRDIE